MTQPVVADLIANSLQQQGRVTITLTGDSMAPLLQHGDVLEVDRCSAEQLTPGDVVLFAGLVVHRFLYASGGGIVARGDGAWATDPLWPKEAVLGRVLAHTRNRRRQRIDRGWRWARGRIIAGLWSLRRRLRHLWVHEARC
ncbi:MAG: S24/S26 family peptidase [Planctomycetota bacterium]